MSLRRVIFSSAIGLFVFVGCLTNADKNDATGGPGLVAQGSSLTLNGKPFQIFSGSIHYFRVPPQLWRDRLTKFKAAGLNTVEVYVPWNLHEPEPGQFDFSGILDIVQFLKTAQSVGLYVLLRPGPYICAEWEWGGHPYWLLKDPNMKVRTMYPGYVKAVEAYFGRLIRIVSRSQLSQGGPIIAVQVENEYGAYGSDQNYLKWLRTVLQRNGIVELFFTSDGPTWLKNGTIPGLFTVVNFQDSPANALGALKQFQPNRPLMVGEFWSGWFDHWGERHHVWTSDRFENNLKVILEQNASVNFYMFHGGTNFGFMNGANRYYKNFPQQPASYLPTVTSYDYDAPLTEGGQTTAKYFIVQQLMKQYNPDFHLTEELEGIAEDARVLPANQPKQKSAAVEQNNNNKKKMERNMAMMTPVVAGKDGKTPTHEAGRNQFYEYGPASNQKALPLTDALRSIAPIAATKLATMESFGQAYGFIAYRATLQGGGILSLSLTVADRLQVILNGVVVKTVLSTAVENNFVTFKLPIPAGTSNDLILMAENLGRVNYDMAPNNLDNERKGLTGGVVLNKQYIDNWRVYNLQLGSDQFQSLQKSPYWKSLPDIFAPRQTQPTFYQIIMPYTEFSPVDHYLDLQAYTKGVAFVNGINIGRYWTSKGPSTTLYCPAAFFNSYPDKNEVILFELEKPGDAIEFVEAINYGLNFCNMPCSDTQHIIGIGKY